tara:strand:+ start:303 stop:497 length:195 start_codon:yes stop_codon:yes gene_type:complete
MTDKENFIKMVEEAGLDYDNWGGSGTRFMIDSGYVEVLFDSEGNLRDIIGSGVGTQAREEGEYE